MGIILISTNVHLYIIFYKNEITYCVYICLMNNIVCI